MGWQDDTILSSATSAPDAVPALRPQKGNLWDNDPILATADQLQPFARPAHGLIESIEAGAQVSIPGLLWRGKLPELFTDPETSKWWERALSGITNVAGDLPAYGLGGAFGGAAGAATGNPVLAVLGAGAGTFGVPGLMRSLLIHGYNSGEIKTAEEFWNALRNMAGDVAKTTAEDAAIGALTFGTGLLGKVGTAGLMGANVAERTAIGYGTATMATKGAQRIVSGVDTAAQIAAMTTMPAALQGRLPSMKEILDGAIVIGGLKLIHPLSVKIANVFVKTGKTPAEQVADVKANPDLAKQYIEEPPRPEKPTPLYAEVLSKQEELFSIQGKLREFRGREGGKEGAQPLTEAEIAEKGSLQSKAAGLEGELSTLTDALSKEPPAVSRETPTGFSPEQLIEARNRAAARIAELTTQEGKTPLTDAERVERIGLVNALNKPEELARRFAITPERRIPTAEERTASAQRVYDDVLRQAREIDAARTAGGLEPIGGEEYAQAIAKLVSDRVKSRADRLGRLSEEIYNERPLKARDQSQGGGGVPEELIPPEAPRFPSPEVDIFGNKLEPETLPRMAVENLPTVETPLADLTLSKEVPQFKKDANTEGVIVPLGGTFDRTGVGPIQVWERLNGDMEVISGRHRLDLARRSGETTIPAQIHREADGFDAKQAATLDAQLNIREEQGSVADYTQYFRDSGISKDAAEQRGLLARAKGRAGWTISRDGGVELIAAHRAGLLSDDAALAISQTAPGSERLQVMGIAMVNDGKSILYATNMMRSLDLMASERAAGGQQGDIFGFDDSAMVEAAAMAKKASSAQRHISEQIAAVSGAVKRPELARKMGVNVEDPEGIRKRIAELRQEQYRWDNWPLYPDLVARLRGEEPAAIEQIQAQIEAAPVVERQPAAEVAPAVELSPQTKKLTDRLRSLASGLDVAIENGRRPMTSNPTPKRNAEYKTRLHEANNNERTQKALLALADAHEKGIVPDILFNVKSKADIAPLVRKNLTGEGGYYDRIESLDYADASPKAKALQQLMDTKPETADEAVARVERERAQKITRLASFAETGKATTSPGTFFQTSSERPEFDLKAETPAEAIARDAEAADAAKRKIAQEKEGVEGPAQTVDQTDIFALQRTLFKREDILPSVGVEKEIQVAGFKRFIITPNEDKKFSIYGNTKVGKELYFYNAEAIKREDGTYRLSGSRWETFTGKPIRGKANLILEDLTDKVSDTVSKLAPTLFQGKGQERNGEHLGSYTVAENLITTFKNANKSTIVHELGHSWLEEMKIDAMRPDAPAQIKADWETVRREFAISESGEISTASHEQFARTAERYLAEGRAPSVGLRGVFERFKTWMLDIYKNLSSISTEINPEVRGVFDRMLATDQEIADARELGVPRAYVDLARRTEAEKIVPEARKIEPGFAAEQASMNPFADELPPGPGKAPDNIHVNYKFINSPMDVKLAMQRMAEIDQANIQKQRGGAAGVKSWEAANAEQAQYLNDILGGSEDTLRILSPRDPNAAGPDVKLGVLKKLAVGAAKDSARLRDIVLQAGHDATVRQQLEYMGSIERARMIQGEFLGERAGVARALNALKDVTEGTGEIGRMLDVIGYGEAAARELYQAARTPAEEQAYLKAQLDAIMLNYRGKTVLDIARLHKEIGSLKGSYGFAKKVTEATTWEMLVEGWKSFILSGPVTHTTNFFGTETFHWLQPAVDVLAATIGMARGASPGMGETDRASMSEAIERMTGMLSGVQDGLKVGMAAMRTGEGTGKTESYREAIPGQLGHIIRTPLRLMGAEDAMVTTMYERGELKTLAIRQAFDENLNPKTQAFAARVEYLVDHPTPEIEARALATATRMTFNAPYGEKGRALVNFINKWNLQWMIPFTRTPINIALEMLRLSPFAPGVAEWRAEFAKGGAARDRALAEVALGTGISALTMAYAFSGSITGAGSPDPGKNRSKEGVWQPYSIFIDGKWYEYSRIQPVGTLMGMAADMANIWDHMTDEEKDKLPKLISTAFANAITNQTFLQGITNFVNAISDPTRFAPRLIEQFAGSMVPNIIAQPTAMMDPNIREINGMFEAIQARIPGWREGLLPSRDWLGEPRASKERVGVIMPVRELKPSEDKVRLEAARLNLSLAAPPKKTHLGKGTGKIGDVPLTPEEQDTFAKVGGEMAHSILTNIVNAPGYDEIPDLVKRKIFSKVVAASHQAAAVAALPMDKRISYLQSISEKMQAELAPGE